MHQLKRNRLVIVVGILCICVFGAVGVYVVKFGSAYRKEVGSYENNTPHEETKLAKEVNVRRVRIHELAGSGCMDVSSDGVVSEYSQCGTVLDRVDRPNDSKNVVRLLRLIAEHKWTTVKPQGKVILIDIETDTGIQTGYISVDDSGDKEIVEIIDTVKGDIPKDTPTPTPTPVPTVPPGVTVTPTDAFAPTAVPTDLPLPGTTPLDHGFTCGYTHGGKPTNVSQTMCSTGPTPVQ